MYLRIIYLCICWIIKCFNRHWCTVQTWKKKVSSFTTMFSDNILHCTTLGTFFGFLRKSLPRTGMKNHRKQAFNVTFSHTFYACAWRRRRRRNMYTYCTINRYCLKNTVLIEGSLAYWLLTSHKGMCQPAIGCTWE